MNANENEIKKLNTALDEPVYRLRISNQYSITIKNLKNLFTVVKKPLNTSGNNDVEVIFSEEISNVIKKQALVSEEIKNPGKMPGFFICISYLNNSLFF